MTGAIDDNTLTPASGATVGLIGLGRMGSPMALNLAAAGYPLTVFDVQEDRLTPAVAAGASAADSVREVVEQCDVVLTSLPSSAVFVEVADAEFVQPARLGQVFIDTGTTVAGEARRISAALAARGASLLEAPVSGGPAGVAGRKLHIFAGGERAQFDRCLPILISLGGHPDHTAWCGPTGCGQAVKAVNQLAMGLVDAAYLEAISFGVRAGADLGAIAKSVGGDESDFRRHIARLAATIEAGRGDEVLIKFPELPYFLAEARERGFAMPMTEALYAFCDAGPRDWTDNMDRPRVALWHQLMQAVTPPDDEG